MTAEELLALGTSQRCELVRGELRPMSPSGFEHGAIAIQLGALLLAHVRRQNLGVVLGAETGYTLARGPDTVRGADVSFVSAARVPPGPLTKKFWEGAPDLAVEVISPDDRAGDIEEKVDEYLRAGARLVWVVSPKLRSVTIYRPTGNPQVLRETDELSGEDVMPGFACRVSEIFP
jgi:Uma2 family endonuclease